MGYSSGTIDSSSIDVYGTVSGNEYVGGLVGENAGTIDSSSVDIYGTVSGNNWVGGLVGRNYSSATIYSSNVDIYGTVSGSDDYVGGLVGSNNGIIQNSCSVTIESGGEVSGYWYVGGLVGHNDYGTIQDFCSVTIESGGEVSGNNYVGGLVGHNYSGTIQDFCSVTIESGGEVSGNYFVGGLVGENQNYGTIQSSCSVTIEDGGTVSGSERVGGLVGYNSSTIQNSTATFFSGASLNGLSAAGGLVGYNYYDYGESGIARITDSYSNWIYNVLDLQLMKYNLSGTYTVQNNIDASDTANWNSGAGFEPVGGDMTWEPTNCFTGTFDGNNHTISHLYINRNAHAVGLFGAINNPAIIRDVGLIDIHIIATGQTQIVGVGGLIGGAPNDDDTWGAFVENCYVTGTIDAQSNADNSFIGGLAGCGHFITFSNCYSTAQVKGDLHVGGLIGYGAVIVNNSYASGPVSGESYIGGFIGNLAPNSGVSVNNCYSTGTVTATGSYLGGFIGYRQGGDVTNCGWWTEAAAQPIGNGGSITYNEANKSAFYSPAHGVYAVGTANQWDFFTPVWDTYKTTYPHLSWENYTGDAENYIWTGNTSTEWDASTGSNWSTGLVPIATSNVFIFDRPNDPTLTATANIHDITIVSGVLTAGYQIMNVSGNWTNNAGPAGFIAGSSIVIFVGAANHTIKSGGAAFNNLEILAPDGQAIDLNGVNQYIDSIIIDPDNYGGTGFSISLWVYLRSYGSATCVYSWAESPPYYGGVWWGINSSGITGDLRFGNGRYNGYLPYTNLTTVIPTNEWVFLTATHGTDGWNSAYINGNWIKDWYTGPLANNDSMLKIGLRSDASWYTNGLIDEMAVYASELSAGEIASMYSNHTYGTARPDLIAGWHFDGNTNDYSGNGRNGTPRNGPSYGQGIISQPASATLGDPLIVAGNLIIDSGATLNADANNITVAGNWVNNGTFTHGGGAQTVNLNGSGTMYAGSSLFNNLSVISGDRYVIGPLTVNNLFDLTGGTFIAGGNTVSVGGFGRSGSGFLNIDDSTFVIKGDVNLTGGGGSINNSLVIMDLSDRDITVNSAAGFVIYDGIIRNLSSQTRQLTYNTPYIYQLGDAEITNTGGGSLIVDARTNDTAITIYGDYTQTGGEVLLGSGALTISGNCNISGGLLSQDDGNVVFDGLYKTVSLAPGTYSAGSGQLRLYGYLELDSDGNNLGHVVVGSSPDTVILTSDLNAIDLTISAEDWLATDGYDITLSHFLTIYGGLDASRGTDADTIITLGGDWTNSGGAFTADNSTVIFNGTSANTITSNADDNSNHFNNVIFAPGSNYTLADPLYVDGDLAIQKESGISAGAPGSWPESYSYRKTITIDHAKVGTGGVSGFPVLFSVTDDELTAANVKNGSNYTIRFRNASGDIIPYEVEYYNDGGPGARTLVAWVKADLSDTQDTRIYLYYGTTNPASTEQKTAVWSEGYAGVWHMAETNATDSTINNNNGTAYGNVIYTDSGKIGGADNFNGSNSYIDLGNPSTLQLVSNFTISAWIKPATNHSGCIMSKGNPTQTQTRSWDFFYGFGPQNDKMGGYFFRPEGSFFSGSSVDSVSATDWHYVIMQHDSSLSNFQMRVFVDGAELTMNFSYYSTTSVPTLRQTSAPIYIGVHGAQTYFNGILDEMRISTVLKSEGWITTEYNNQSDSASFFMANGTLNALTHDIYIKGSLTVNGTLNTSGMVTFNGSEAGKTIYAPTTEFNNVTVNGAGGVWTMESDLDVNGTLAIDEGALHAGMNNITIAGDFVNTDIFTSAATVTFDGTGTQHVSTGDASIYDVVIDKDSGSVVLQEPIDVGNDLAITSGALDVNANGISAGNDIINHGLITNYSGDIVLNAMNIYPGTIANNALAGSISVNAAACYLDQNASLASNDGAIDINAPVSGDYELALDAGSAGISLQSVDVDTLSLSGGNLHLFGPVLTDKGLNFTGVGSIEINDDISITANDGGSSPKDITFGPANVIIGSHYLTLDGANITLYQVGDGASDPTGLDIFGSNNILLYRNITVDGPVNFYGPVELGNSITINTSGANGSILFSESLDAFGNQSLILEAGSGVVTFMGRIGNIGGLTTEFYISDLGTVWKYFNGEWISLGVPTDGLVYMNYIYGIAAANGVVYAWGWSNYLGNYCVYRNDGNGWQNLYYDYNYGEAWRGAADSDGTFYVANGYLIHRFDPLGGWQYYYAPPVMNFDIYCIAANNGIVGAGGYPSDGSNALKIYDPYYGYWLDYPPDAGFYYTYYGGAGGSSIYAVGYDYGGYEAIKRYDIGYGMWESIAAPFNVSGNIAVGPGGEGYAPANGVIYKYEPFSYQWNYLDLGSYPVYTYSVGFSERDVPPALLGSLTVTSAGAVNFNAPVNVSGESVVAGEVNFNDGASWTLNDSLTVNGDLNLKSGSNLAAGINNIYVAGDWINNGGSFVAGAGTVEFNGPGTSRILGSTEFNVLTCDTPGKTLEFDANGIQTIAELAITGAPGSLVNIRSLVNGVGANISVSSSSIAYVSVKDSHNTNASYDIPASNSQNLGNNEHWAFGDITYTGTGVWTNAANWSSGVVPGQYDNAAIGYASGAFGACTVDTAVAVNNLTINASSSTSSLITGANTITLTGNYTNLGGTLTSTGGTFVFAGTSPQTIDTGGTGTAKDFYNVTIKDGAIVSPVTNHLYMNGNLIIGEGTSGVLDTNSKWVRVIGTTLINDGAILYLDASSAASRFGFSKDVTNNGSFIIESDANQALLLGSGSPRSQFKGNPITYNGKTVYFGGIFDYVPDVVLAGTGDTISITSGSIYFNNVSLGVGGAVSGLTLGGSSAYAYIAGDFTNTASGIFNCGTGTVTFNADAAGKTVVSAGDPFYNVVFNSPTGSGAWTIDDAMTVGNNFTLTNGSVTQAAGLTILGGYAQSGGIFTIPDPKDPESLPFSAAANFVISGGVFNRFSGSGTSIDPYMVRDIYDLQAIKCYLASNLVFKQYCDFSAASASLWNGGTGFIPLGDATTKFTGTYDGNNKIISGLSMSKNDIANLGLFGYVTDSVLKNINLTGMTVTDTSYSISVNVGGLAGSIESSTIDNVHIAGDISGTANPANVGGLVGYAYRTNIYDSSADVSVAATNPFPGGANAGGLIGYSYAYWSVNSTISGCYTTGSVIASGSGYGNRVNAGGIVGCQYANVFSTALILDSYSTANVSGTCPGYEINVGGIAGFLLADNGGHSNITNAYATGVITGSATYPNIGGLVGRRYGYLGGSSEIVTQSYWDIETSGVFISDGGTPLTTSQMRGESNYTGWDFHTTPIWDAFASTYPHLHWEGYVPEGAVTVSGTAGSAIGANKQVALSLNGAGFVTVNTTDANGSFSFSNVVLASGDRLLIFVNDASYKANMAAVTNGSAAISGLTLQNGRFAIGDTDAAISKALTNADLAAAYYNNSNVHYSVTSGNASFLNSIDLWLPSSMTYAPGGNVSASQDLINEGTFTQNGNVAVTRDFLLNSGSFTCSAPTTYTFSVGRSFTITPTNQGSFNRYETDGSGYKLIRDVYDLQAMKCYLSSNFKLENDIDATPTTNWNSGAGFEPVGTSSTSFMGNFNGQDYTIDGLYMHWNISNYTVGLFGKADYATLSNIHLTNVDITSDLGTAAALLANSGNCSIQNCSVSGGSITGSTTQASWAGGLVGYHGWNNNMQKCFASVSVSGYFAGGLAGTADHSSISNCYATGDVTSTYIAGGLVGRHYNNASITNCYATGTVSGSSGATGGLVGYNGVYFPGYPNILGSFSGHSYWNITHNPHLDPQEGGVGNTVDPSNVHGLNEVKMHGESNYTGWDFHTTPIWDAFASTYPHLHWEGYVPEGAVTVSGTFNEQGAGIPIAFALNGGGFVVVNTTSGGAFSFENVVLNASDKLLVFADSSSYKANLVGIAQNSNAISNITLENNQFSIGDADANIGGYFSNVDLAAAYTPDSDVHYSVSGTGPSYTISFTDGIGLLIPSGMTYAPAGDIYASGDWTNDGAFIAGDSWVIFDSGSAQAIYSGGYDESKSFSNIEIQGQGTNVTVCEHIRLTGRLLIGAAGMDNPATLTLSDGVQVWIDGGSLDLSFNSNLSLASVSCIIEDGLYGYNYYGGDTGVNYSDLLKKFDSTDDVCVKMGVLPQQDAEAYCGSLTIAHIPPYPAGEYTISGGRLYVDGGLFIESSGALTVLDSSSQIHIGGDWTNNGGTFTHGDGTVYLTGGSEIFTNSDPFGYLTIEGAYTLQDPLYVDYDLDFSAGTLTTNGNVITLDGGTFNLGQINDDAYLEGSGSIQSNYNHFIGLYLQNGSSYTMADEMFVDSELNIDGSSSLDQAGSALYAYYINIASGTWRNSGGSITIGEGGVHNDGMIDFTGSGYTIRSDVDGEQRDWYGSGSFSIDGADVKDQVRPLGETPAYILVTNGTDSGNNINWVFGLTGTEISGTFYTAIDASTALGEGHLVVIAINGTPSLFQGYTDPNGHFSIMVSDVKNGDVVGVYSASTIGDIPPEAATITKALETTSMGLNLYANTVAVRSENPLKEVINNWDLQAIELNQAVDTSKLNYITNIFADIEVEGGYLYYVEAGKYAPQASVYVNSGMTISSYAELDVAHDNAYIEVVDAFANYGTLYNSLGDVVVIADTIDTVGITNDYGISLTSATTTAVNGALGASTYVGLYGTGSVTVNGDITAGTYIEVGDDDSGIYPLSFDASGYKLDAGTYIELYTWGPVEFGNHTNAATALGYICIDTTGVPAGDYLTAYGSLRAGTLVEIYCDGDVMVTGNIDVNAGGIIIGNSSYCVGSLDVGGYLDAAGDIDIYCAGAVGIDSYVSSDGYVYIYTDTGVTVGEYISSADTLDIEASGKVEIADSVTGALRVYIGTSDDVTVTGRLESTGSFVSVQALGGATGLVTLSDVMAYDAVIIEGYGLNITGTVTSLISYVWLDGYQRPVKVDSAISSAASTTVLGSDVSLSGIDAGTSLKINGSLITLNGNTSSSSGSIDITSTGDLIINGLLDIDYASSDIDIGGSVTIGSNATVNAGPSYWTIDGDWTCYGEFNGEGSTVEFIGDDNSNSTILGSSEFNVLKCDTAGRGITNKTLEFDHTDGQLQDITTIVLKGRKGDPINVHSTLSADQAEIRVYTVCEVEYVAVQDMNNNVDQAGIRDIIAHHSTDLGNNYGWSFDDITWTGEVSGEWYDPRNWDPWIVPSRYDTVFIDHIADPAQFHPFFNITGTIRLQALTIDDEIFGGEKISLDLRGNALELDEWLLNSGIIKNTIAGEAINITTGLGARTGDLTTGTIENLTDRINLTSMIGNIEVDSIISGDNVTLDARNGSILDANGISSTITADNLTMTSAGHIGQATNPINVAIADTIDLTAGGAGEIALTSDKLNIGKVITATGTVTFNGDVTLKGDSTKGETFELNSKVLDINGSITINNKASLNVNAADNKIFISKGWKMVNGGAFDHNNNEVIFDTINNATIEGETTFWKFTCDMTNTVGQKTIYFEANKLQTIDSVLTLKGTQENKLVLRSTQPGTQWKIDPNVTTWNGLIANVDVQDSNNTSGVDINPENSLGGWVKSGKKWINPSNNTSWFTKPQDDKDEEEWVDPIYIVNPWLDIFSNLSWTSSIAFATDFVDREDLYKKRYAKGKYRTVVIVMEGKVAVADYSEKGVDYENAKMVTDGQKIEVKGEVK
ncbi:MAG: hypothetical protein NC938_03490 [Candidatus Omnitrophica bacterium]|nr:hypothetical protein [Candidatus Omnitrophota bacterium]